jgi:hypothetical protein
MKKKFLLQLTILTMRATNIKATRGAVATIHSGSDRRKKSKTIESTLDQVTGDFHSNFTARARTLVTKMMFWALAGVTFSAAKIVSRNKNFFFHGLPSTLLQLFYFICRSKSNVPQVYHACVRPLDEASP